MSWYAILLFTSLNLLNYFDRYLVQALLPLISHEFALTYEQSGRLASAFVLGYFFTAPVFGILGDKFKRPLLMVIGVALWSGVTFGSGFVTSYAMFLLLRVLVGVGEASFGTIAPGYIKDKIQDPIRLNRVFAIFYAAIPIGSALAYYVSGKIASTHGWHALFLIGGIPGLILCLFLFLCKEVRSETVVLPPWRELTSSLLSNEILRLAIIGYAFNSFGLNAIAAFVTKYGVESGFAYDVVSRDFGFILVITGFVGTLGGGWLVELFAKNARSKVSAMLYFVGFFGVLAVPFAVIAFAGADYTLFLTMCFFAQLFIFAGVAPINSVVVLSAPPHLVTLAQGLCIFLLNLFGAFLGPIVIGFLADTWGLAQALQCSGIALFLSGVAWVYGGKRAARLQVA